MVSAIKPARFAWIELSLALAGAAALAGIAVLYLRHGFFDDSFITFRYARNFARGAGLSWNQGEGPLEGFTSLAWVITLAVAHRLSGVAIPQVALLLGLGANITAALFAWRTARHVLRGSRYRWLSSLVVVQLALTPEFVRQGINGMETSLTALSFAALAHWWVTRDSPRESVRLWLSAGALASATAIVRPDAVLFGLAVAAYRAFELKATRRAWLALVAGTVLPVLMLSLFRKAYFGDWAPLPAYLKLRPAALLQPGPLGFIVGHWLGFLGLIAPSCCVYALARAKRDASSSEGHRQLAVGAAAYMAYFVTVLPIMSIGFRYLMPTLPVFYVLGVWGVATLIARAEVTSPSVWLGAACVLLVAQGLGRFPIVKRDCSSWFHAHDNYAALGKRLSPFEGLRVAVSEVGELGWYSDAAIMDLAGLNDRFIARNRFRSNFPADFADYASRRLPDVFIEPPPEYSYASLRVHPTLRAEYVAVSWGKLEVFVRRTHPDFSRLIAVLAAP